jgi:hypothetical protein
MPPTATTVPLTLYCKACKEVIVELEIDVLQRNKVQYRYRSASLACPKCHSQRAPRMEWGKGDTASGARGAQGSSTAGKPADEADGRGATGSESPPDHGTMTKAELIALCEEQGLATGGTKDALVARLSGE